MSRQSGQKFPFLGFGVVVETDILKSFFFHAFGPFETGGSHGGGVDVGEAGVEGCPGGRGFGVHHRGACRDVLREISMELYIR